MHSARVLENVGIFGVGGVGGYFGGKLCHCQREGKRLKVSFLARGAHLAAIRENGLLLKTEQEGALRCHPFLATDSMEDMPELDLCILCVKGFDLHALLVKLNDRIREDSIILPLLNGVDIHSRIRSVVDRGSVFPACVYVGTHIESPGGVSQKGGACRILLGPDPGNPSSSPAELLEVLRQANILCDWRIDIQSCLWEKFIFISSFGLTTAAHRKTIGQVLEDDTLRGTVMAIIDEAVSIARGLGVPLPEHVAEAALQKGSEFPFEAKTSLHHDVEQEARGDERDLFAGALLNYATELGIPAAATAQVLGTLEKIKPTL